MEELRPEQVRRVIAFVTDEWVDEREDDEVTARALDALFGALESPLELHFCAIGFNWDTSVDELRRLVDHPLCDRGTALAIFWLGQPAHHYAGPLSRMAEDELAVRRLLEAIERRYDGRGYASEEIRFDPAHAGGEDLTISARELVSPDRPVPLSLFEPSPGTVPEIPPGLEQLLPRLG